MLRRRKQKGSPFRARHRTLIEAIRTIFETKRWGATVRYRIAPRLACFLLVQLASATLFGAPISVPAYRIGTPPVIDGTIHEDTEWKGVPTVSGMFDENTSQAAPDAATFWIAYDSEFVYVAARMSDSQPATIRANQYQTNVNLQGDDYIQFDLDLSGTATDFSTFQVNPRGATNTQLAGGRAAKREWAGEFKAAARITPTGWEAEMRIPWQAMSLPPSGAKDLRINIERFQPRTNRMFALAYVPNGSGSNIPIWKGVVVPRSELDRSIKLLPYAYGGYDPKVPWIFNSGMDLKTSLADQVELVGSIEPDFRNIENQILNLDFSRFQRLAGESRPFFLEGSQYIGSALFASQLIPRFDVGANAYGKLSDRTSFGVLDTEQISRENDLVANGTYSPDPNSSYRFGITDLDRAGTHNAAYLARYQGQWGDWGAFLRDMGSKDNLVGQGDNANVSGFYSAAGVNAFAEYTRVTPNFMPRLGFFPEVDYRGWDGNISYSRPFDHGPISNAGGSFIYLTYDHANGYDYRRMADVSGATTFRNGLGLRFDEDLEQFEGSDDHLTTAAVTYPQWNIYNLAMASYTWGREAGISYGSLTLSAYRRLFDRLQLTGRYQEVAYGGFNDQAILDLNWDLRKDSAVGGRLVKQGPNINGYLAFRRSGNLGAEYYLIIGDPNALRFRPSIILKVAIPLSIGRHGAPHPVRS